MKLLAYTDESCDQVTLCTSNKQQEINEKIPRECHNRKALFWHSPSDVMGNETGWLADIWSSTNTSINDFSVPRINTLLKVHTKIHTRAKNKVSRLMTKLTKWHVRPAKTQISLGIRPVWSVFARLIWVFAGRTCHFVGFVMRRLKCTSKYELKLCVF